MKAEKKHKRPSRPEPTISVDEQTHPHNMDTSEQFSTGLGDQTLLDKIDKLFACGVGSYIDLPQLIVVGDQSSGKSSVLEALTALPFPRDSGLCTRFATQIVFRRSDVKKLSVSIIPAGDASAEHINTVTAWHKEGLEDLDAKSFADIMREATDIMGISGSQDSRGEHQSTFSQDVLKLELVGPLREHLSVVDIPGIFKNTTEGKTTKEDITIVRDMVLSYMRNPRSVMLTIIPANIDIANQEILLHARELDPDGERTLGILTKPDLVDPGSEQSVLDILNGRSNALNLGWHILRNSGQLDLGQSAEARNRTEMTFFNTKQPWTNIDGEKVGVKNLRLRLQAILSNHTKREFPRVRAELHKNYTQCKLQLEDLGASRDDTRDQLRYLHGIANEFEQLTRKALNTEYASSEIFQTNSDMKLATIVRNRDEQFSQMLSQYGHRYKFVNPDEEDTKPLVEAEDQKGIEVCLMAQATVVEDLLRDNILPVMPPLQHGIMDWLKKLHNESRGFELGTFQASILANSMSVQSMHWDALASGYINDIILTVHKFTVELINHVCVDKRVSQSLLLALDDGLSLRYKKAVECVNFLLHVERKETPTTVTEDFSDELVNRRARERQRIEKTNAEHLPEVYNVDGSIATLPQSDTKENTESQMIRDIHDILASYYEVARKRFTDNVVMQAGGHYLVNGPESLLKLFGSAFVESLSDEKLEEIAGEEMGRKLKRKQLQKMLEDLEMGKKVLR